MDIEKMPTVQEYAEASKLCDGNEERIFTDNSAVLIPENAVINNCPQRRMMSRKARACLKCQFFVGVKETAKDSHKLQMPHWAAANHIICGAPLSRSLTIAPLED